MRCVQALATLMPRRFGGDLFFKKRVIVDSSHPRRRAISEGASESCIDHCFTKRTSSADKVVPGMALPLKEIWIDEAG